MKKMKTDECQHPKHIVYLKAFLREYPTANKHAHYTINLVDLKSGMFQATRVRIWQGAVKCEESVNQLHVQTFHLYILYKR